MYVCMYVCTMGDLHWVFGGVTRHLDKTFIFYFILFYFILFYFILFYYLFIYLFIYLLV